MTMLLRLTKQEALALTHLCRGPSTVSGLASSLGAGESFASRLVHSLEEKGLAAAERKGVGKTVRLSDLPHAQAFRRLYDSRPQARIEEWVSGHSIEVLIVLLDNGAKAEALLSECACSKPSLYKVLNSLIAVGVVGKTEWGAFRIVDRSVSEFTEGFANGVQLQMQKQLHGHNVGIRVRKHVLVRSDAKEAPAWFAATGISLLADKGLEAVQTSYSDYYFNLDGRKREIGVEEAFIHALLLTTVQQHQDKPVLAIFLNKNWKRLNQEKLWELARSYHVENDFKELVTAIGYHVKLREWE